MACVLEYSRGPEVDVYSFHQHPEKGHQVEEMKQHGDRLTSFLKVAKLGSKFKDYVQAQCCAYVSILFSVYSHISHSFSYAHSSLCNNLSFNIMFNTIKKKPLSKCNESHNSIGIGQCYTVTQKALYSFQHFKFA